GEAQREARALADLALHLERPAGGGDDAVDHHEAEPGALADRPGGEEGLEDAVEVLLGDALARVLDHDLHVRVVGARDDADLTALGHRVARVEAEVGDAELELRAIARDGGALRAEVETQRDVGRKDAEEELLERAEGLIDLERLRGFGGRVPPEHEEFARELGGALHGAVGLFEHLRAARAELLPPAHDVDEAADGLEEVVEVVRDPAGETAEALEASPPLALDLELASF